MEPDSPDGPGGASGARGGKALARGVRDGVLAGLRAGFLFGLIDSAIAAWRVEEPIGLLGGLGCVAAAVLVYSVTFAVLLGALGAVLSLLPARAARRTGPTGSPGSPGSPGRARQLFGLGLGVGLFFEVYWWTRPFVFWGYSALSVERLGAAAGMLVVALGVAAICTRLLARVPRGLAALAVPGALVFAVGGAFFLASERALLADGRLGAIDDANRDLPNVLFVMVDALRADVIGAYGSERVRTPVIDGLARDGVLFENAFVQAPFTWSSFGSFLTGKYPRRHGMLKLGPGLSWVRQINTTIPLHLKSGRRTNGARLEDEDYASAAFMTGAVTRGSGLLRGVDMYCEALLGHELVHRASRWSRFSSDLLAFNVWNKLTQQIDYNKAGSTAVEWLAENAAQRRFFALLHLYSTHTPYDPAEEFRAMYVDPAYGGPIDAFYAQHRYAIESGDYAPTEADVEQIRNLYYGGVTQADHALGLVLEALEASGVLDDTIVILTSDHGEELGEHGVWEHNWMYQTNLRIPLVLRWPRGLPAGRRVSAMVDSIDVLPTLCELMGLELPEIPTADAEYHRIDGTSLVPLVRGEVERVRELSFAESGPSLAVQDAGWKLVVSKDCLELAPGDAGWEKADRAPQLYDLAADPGETTNLFGGDDPRTPGEVARLLAALRAWDASLPIPREANVSSHRDLETEQLLDGLGYVGGIGDDEHAEHAEGDAP
jgi:arylsulfatase A-like enzyme